jgi:hypothetical protein
MTVYSKTLTLVVGGTTVTQNVVTGDTISLTINGGGSTWTRTGVTNCTTSATTGSAGATITVTPSGSTSYSASFQSVVGSGKSNTVYSGTLSGNFVAVPDDPTPENYTNLGGNVTNAATDSFYYATFSTSTPGTTANGTGLSLSGVINVTVNVQANSGEFRTAANSTWKTTGTATSSDTIYFRARTSSLAGTTRTHSLGIGTNNRSFSTTTSGSGSGATGYGFKVFNSSAQTIVDSDVDRQTTAIVTGTVNVTGNGGQSVSISCAGMNIYNQEIIDVLYLDYPDPTPTNPFGGVTTIRENGSFKVKLTSGSTGVSYTVKYAALRY